MERFRKLFQKAFSSLSSNNIGGGSKFEQLFPKYIFGNQIELNDVQQRPATNQWFAKLKNNPGTVNVSFLNFDLWTSDPDVFYRSLFEMTDNNTQKLDNNQVKECIENNILYADSLLPNVDILKQTYKQINGVLNAAGYKPLVLQLPNITKMIDQFKQKKVHNSVIGSFYSTNSGDYKHNLVRLLHFQTVKTKNKNTELITAIKVSILNELFQVYALLTPEAASKQSESMKATPQFPKPTLAAAKPAPPPPPQKIYYVPTIPPESLQYMQKALNILASSRGPTLPAGLTGSTTMASQAGNPAASGPPQPKPTGAIPSAPPPPPAAQTPPAAPPPPAAPTQPAAPPPPAAQPTLLKNDPKYEKYYKMKEMGVPDGAIAQKMKKNKENPKIIDYIEKNMLKKNFNLKKLFEKPLPDQLKPSTVSAAPPAASTPSPEGRGGLLSAIRDAGANKNNILKKRKGNSKKGKKSSTKKSGGGGKKVGKSSKKKSGGNAKSCKIQFIAPTISKNGSGTKLLPVFGKNIKIDIQDINLDYYQTCVDINESNNIIKTEQDCKNLVEKCKKNRDDELKENLCQGPPPAENNNFDLSKFKLYHSPTNKNTKKKTELTAQQNLMPKIPKNQIYRYAAQIQTGTCANSKTVTGNTKSLNKGGTGISAVQYIKKFKDLKKRILEENPQTTATEAQSEKETKTDLSAAEKKRLSIRAATQRKDDEDSSSWDPDDDSKSDSDEDEKSPSKPKPATSVTKTVGKAASNETKIVPAPPSNVPTPPHPPPSGGHLSFRDHKTVRTMSTRFDNQFAALGTLHKTLVHMQQHAGPLKIQHQMRAIAQHALPLQQYLGMRFALPTDPTDQQRFVANIMTVTDDTKQRFWSGAVLELSRHRNISGGFRTSSKRKQTHNKGRLSTRRSPRRGRRRPRSPARRRRSPRSPRRSPTRRSWRQYY